MTSSTGARAVVAEGGCELSGVVASSEALHARFGGVVPEIACRAHLASLIPVLSSALTDAGMSLDDVDALAVTNRPGLVGAQIGRAHG